MRSCDARDKDPEMDGMLTVKGRWVCCARALVPVNTLSKRARPAARIKVRFMRVCS